LKSIIKKRKEKNQGDINNKSIFIVNLQRSQLYSIANWLIASDMKHNWGPLESDN